MTPTGFILRGGLRLAVHDAGGTGAPVLFQHGLCGDAAQTAEAFPPIKGHRRVTLDCRGHGASEAGDDLSIATFADDVAALAEILGPPLILGGISMGAAIATRIAVTRPDLVRALILVRPAWIADPAPANMAPNAEVGDLLSRMPPAAARAAFVAGPTHARLSREAPDNLASLLGFFDRAPADVTARLLTRISADGPGVSEGQLGTLTVPTLICGTAEDAIHPYESATRLAALIPGASLAQLPPKGRDKPAHLTALHAAIARFMKEL